MAKIALRAYNREIESMIESGHLEEAVGHCQHILKTYPKYLEAYRMMAKSYLEAHRYNDAADLFQRVLFSAPDDFVSHLAMSLIRDEENNLDAAIWHMERAYEQQPSNAALQAELKRLYGRRDGMEPLKIRLTRGALAQMYARGDQYAQAIAEIRSVLAEDPDRTDLQVLLARVYFKAGQRVEATEMCNTLLKKYPYTLEANRLMVEILPGTGRAESAQVYRQRVIQLDPYAAFVTESLENANDVPENTITIERLSWDPDAGAGYFALPESAGQPAPDWMSAPETEQPSAALPTAQEDIPDFLKDAGWGPSSGQFQETPASFDDSDLSDSPLGEIAAAEIPDWLKSMAPPAGAQANALTGTAEDVAGEAEADLGFLADLGLPPDQPQPATESDDWLSSLGASDTLVGAQPPALEPEPAAETPDWLSSLGEEPSETPSAQPATESDDWLSSLGAADTLVGAQLPALEPEPAAETPDWLSSLGEEKTLFSEQPANELPPVSIVDQSDADWLAGLGAAGAAVAASMDVPAEPEPVPGPELVADKVELSAEEQLSSLASGPGVSATEQDDAFAWLESLAAKQGAKPEELLVKPEERLESAPGWVEQVDAQPPAAPEPEFTLAATPEEQLSPLASGPGVSATEQDDAFAWLESLAAKQGAKPEELLVKPEERLESAPGWVEQVGETPETMAALPQDVEDYQPEPPIEAESELPAGELSPLMHEPGTSAHEQEDALAWLEALAAKQGANPEELITAPEERHEQAPDWVHEVFNPPTQTSPLAAGPGVSAAEQEESLAWLESLAEKHGAKPEELVTPPDARTEEAPAWLDAFSSEAAAPEPALPEVSAPFGDLPEADSLIQHWREDESALPEFAGNAEQPLQEFMPAETGEMPVLPEEGVTTWLQQLDAAETEQKPTPVAAPEAAIWFDTPATTAPATARASVFEDEDIPDWLRSESADAIAPTPAPQSEWVPEPAPAAAQTEAQPEVPDEPAVSAPAPVAVAEPVPAARPRTAAYLSGDKDAAILADAQTRLNQGELKLSLQEYTKLIKKGKMLDEIIYDLREATYRYPVDVSVWQSLGDAYMRANRLQDALDAFTRAEELLR